MTRDDLREMVKKAQARKAKAKRARQMRNTKVVDTIKKDKMQDVSKSFKKYNLFNRPRK